MSEVFITKAGKYLPNDAVSNDDMENLLGIINETASKARKIILRNNGIQSRYYAIDKSGAVTHTNADLTYGAIRELFDEEFTPNDIEVLSCGTSTPDHLLPSHAAMVHGLMKNRSVELNSSSGVCCSGMNALKYGYLSVKSGNSTNAVCTGSERVSSWMLADKFKNEILELKNLNEQPIIAFKKDFLRWMLSDGAGAFLLQNQPKGDVSLRIDWMEAYSFAHELEACMYAGGDKLENGELKPWSDYPSEDWEKKSLFAIKQDVKILDQHILEKGSDCIVTTLEKHDMSPSDFDYFLPHVSSKYFVDKFYEAMIARDIDFPKSMWFMNLPKVGNVGSASVYLMVEELMNSGKLQKGQKILLIVPESGRFSYAHACLTVC